MSDRPKVLIADDEQSAIDFVREALADMPCDVIAAMDGEQALSAIRQQKPQVVILDVQMPKRSGFEVFSEMRADQTLSSIPVIMLTAVTSRTGLKFSSKDMSQYMGSEPDAYVDKPIEPVILKQTVKHLLNKSRGK